VNFRKAGRRDETTIELTPLIDVVFLLLIFFLITTTFVRPEQQNQSAQIPVNLPSGVSGKAIAEGERLILTVTEEGKIRLEDGTVVEGESLVKQLEELHETTPDAAILLRGDTSARHGKVVEILDTIKESGFTEVNLVIDTKGTQDNPKEPASE
jgi:biopolymer transport protein ExbD